MEIREKLFMNNFFSWIFICERGSFLYRAAFCLLLLLLSSMMVVWLNHKNSTNAIRENSAILNCDKIIISKGGYKTILIKKDDGWYVDSRDFPAQLHMVKKLLYNLSNLEVKQQLDLDENGVSEMGLSSSQPDSNTISVVLYEDSNFIKKAIFGNYVHPHFGEKSIDQHLTGKGENSYRAVFLQEGSGVEQIFLTPANLAKVQALPEMWLSRTTVPQSSKILSVSIFLPDGKVTKFTRGSLLSVFENSVTNEELPYEYSSILNDILNPGFSKLYDVVKSKPNVNDCESKLTLEIVTMGNIKYTICLVPEPSYHERDMKESKDIPMLQLTSPSDSKPKFYARAEFYVDRLSDDAELESDLVTCINESNENRDFIVKMDYFKKILNFIENEK